MQPDWRPTGVRWLVFALACGASWFLYLHRYTWNFIRPELEREFELTNTQLETLFAVFNLSYALGQLPSGIVCDLFGAHLFLAVTIAAWSLTLPWFGAARTVPQLGGLRFLFGLAQAGCYPAISPVTRAWFPRRSRTIVQGIIVSFFGRGGGAMASLVMGTLLMGSLGLTWRAALVVMSVAGLLFAVAFWLLYRDRPELDPRVNQAERELIREGEIDVAGPAILPARRALRNRTLQALVVHQFLNAGADFMFVSLMGSFFLQTHRLDAATAGVLVSLPLWGGALGGIAGGFLNDGLILATANRRRSRQIAGFSGQFLAASCLLVAAQPWSALLAAFWLFVVKFFTDITQPTIWGVCTDMGGRYAGTTFSIGNMAGNLGALATPLVAGRLLDAYSRQEVVAGVPQTVTNFTPVFVLAAGMYFVAAVCWLLIDCTQRLDLAELDPV